MKDLSLLLNNYYFLTCQETLSIFKELKEYKKTLDSKPNSDYGSEMYSLKTEILISTLFSNLRKNYNCDLSKDSVEYKIIEDEVYKKLHKIWFGRK